MSKQKRTCRSCGKPFVPRHHLAWYCQKRDCGGHPAVYRFVCPDGKSYVGSRQRIRNRKKEWKVTHRGWGPGPNQRVRAAFARYPPDTWSFEILEWLPKECSKLKRLEAEQRHIDRLRSWSLEYGFNINPALWSGDGPSQRAGRIWRMKPRNYKGT
jgi:hypothetical protein